MRRYSTLIQVIALAALLALICGSPSTAVVPKPDGYLAVNLAQGWYADQQAWYIGTATNDIRFAQTGGLVLTPKLSSAIPSFAPPIYIVQNFQQGPVFSATPTDPIATGYTGLWRVYYVKWTTAPPRPITNSSNESIANPTGLPVTGATITATNIVVDYPMLVLGPLGIAGPTYKIPQMVSFNAVSKTAVMPFFNVFCQDYITKKVSIKSVLATESSDRDVAALAGLNYARALRTMDDANSMGGWALDPFGAINPPAQLPILEYCPTASSWRNTNFNYSPIVKGHILVRVTASPSSIINNPTTVKQLLTSGALTQSGTTTLNIHVLNGQK